MSKNTFYEKDSYIVGTTSKGEEFLFDKEDLDLVERFTWCINGNGYIQTHDVSFYSRIITLHRIILKLEDPKLHVDHINHDKLDNRKFNLRVCTNQYNQGNSLIRSDNTSGYKGVSWHKKHQKWYSKIKVNGKTKHLGLFESKEEAALAYNKAALTYFGEFAKLNEVV